MNKMYIDGMNEIKASNELKRKIISNIKDEKISEPSHFFNLKKAAVVIAMACSFVLILSFTIILTGNQNNTDKQSQSLPLFSGFVVTAYAADGTTVEVKPNVEFILGKYELTMSSTPGFPVKIICDNAEIIRLTVTDGEFILWKPEDSKIINKRKSLDVKSGDMVYWSPMVEGSTKIASNCTLAMEAFKDNNKLGSNTITIESNDSFSYTGKLIK